MSMIGNSAGRFLTLFLICIISACGGGGDSKSPTPPPPPVISLSGNPLTSVDEMQSYAFQVVVENSLSTTLTYSVSNMPSWAVFNTGTGALSGTPSFDDSGQYGNIVISVSDGSSSASLPAFSIEVVNVNRLPVISGVTNYEILERQSIAFLIEATDADLDSVAISLENQPAWLSFDESTSQLIGQTELTDSGTYQFNINLDDGGNELATYQASLIVKDAIEIQGKVIDGYVSGAVVYIDENSNVAVDENEFSTITDDAGRYTLLLPVEMINILAQSPIRAYLGADAKDISRPELDFMLTPLTLTLSPINIEQGENGLFQNKVISPFSQQLFDMVEDQVSLMAAGDLSVSEMQMYIEQAKRVITRNIIANGNISLNSTQTEVIINDIVFGDFIANATGLSFIGEQASDYIDLLISHHRFADYDGDGIANNDDNDDDSDNVDDSIDAFPFDPTEWQDSDGDGVGDNSDAYPNNALCSDITDGDGESCYLSLLAVDAAELIAISEHEVAYVYLSNSTLITFDLITQHTLNVQQIENVTSMIFHEQHQRLYLGLNSYELKYLADDYSLVDFVTDEQCVNALVEANALLIVLDCRGYVGTYVTFNVDGELLDESDNYYDSSRVNGWNASMNRLYHFRDGISPNDLYYRTVSDSGEFIDVQESPYHGDYQITGPIVISNDGSKVLLGSGDLYDAATLNWMQSIGEQFTQSFWLDSGDLVTLSPKNDEGNTILRRRDVNFNLVEIKEISGNLTAIKSFADKAIFLLEDGEQVHIVNYLPSNDSDNDGVVNNEDAFPLDNSASLDSDFDGYPDSWNEGRTGENSHLTIDAYPLDSACWLTNHGNDNGCNVLSTQPNFTPDRTVYDNDGNIYFLSAANKRIYRWSSAMNQFTNPIVLSSSIFRDFGEGRVMTYSSEHNRIYVGYDSGVVSRFDLDELKEFYFVALGRPINGIAAVGKFILAENANGAWNTHYIIDRYAEVTDSKEWNRHSVTYAWNEQNSRVYFLRDGTSPNDLHYETIDQTLGHITESGESPYHSGNNIRHPVRVSEGGDFIILGSGSVFAVEDLTLAADLDLFATDIISKGDYLYSVENQNDLSTLKIWQVADFSLTAEIEFAGSALALVPDGDELNLVSHLHDGSLNVAAVGIVDGDQDGLPLWWETLYNLDDTDATDAGLDPDNDELSNLEEFTFKTNPIVADTDNDGLLDGAEVNTHRTSPLNADSDNDGLIDGLEVNVHGTNPLSSDSDGDGLTDREEVEDYYSNPLSSDSDGDGLSDFYEVTHQLNINVNDANEDADSDGLVNLDEMTYQTNPNKADSDNDELNDGDEVHIYLTLPLNRDSDDDKMPDGWEVRYDFSPLSNADSEIDFDRDGFNNKLEFFLATDPTDIDSVPVIEPWVNHQGNSGHNGFIASNINVNDLSLRWTVTIDDVNNVSTAIAADGRVLITAYSSSNEKLLINLNSANGSQSWKNTYSAMYSISDPAYKNNKIYFQAADYESSKLYASDIVSGDNVFVSEFSGNANGRVAPTTTDDGVYISSDGYKFDLDTGDTLWSGSQSWCNEWAPAIDEENYYYFSNGFKIADKDTGEITHSNSDENYLNLSCLTPSFSQNGNVYVTANGQLLAFDRNTAATLWSLGGGDYQSFDGMVTTALGQIYVLRSGELVVVDEYSGEVLWTWKTQNNNSLRGAILASTNIIFVQDYNNTYAIDINSQQQVWSYPASGRLSLSNEGALFITQADGVITAINIGGDSDGDGIADWWEELYGLNSHDDTDALLNADNDELTNLEEFQHSTNPLNEDSDNDGLSDSDEVNTHQSNPLNNDTDNDGMYDAWEVTHDLNLLNEYDAFADADNDDISNIDEFTEGTDPTDGESKPDVVETLNISFEAGVIPNDWIIDETTVSSWGVSSIESSDGDYSIFSSDQATISYSRYFNGNIVKFDFKAQCQYSSYLSIYIDGELVTSAASYEDWHTQEISIPRGRHTLTFKTNDCGIYLDNLVFSPLLSLSDMDIETVTVVNQELHYYGFEQQFIQSVEIPRMGHSARDLTVLDDGRVAVFNGVFEPSLSIYNPLEGTWRHRSFESWGIANNGTYGGIAHSGNYIFVTDMSISGNNTAGIIRFDLETNAAEFFVGEDYIDVVIGLDTMLYALSGRQVDQYDPLTMVLTNSFTISEARAISVDENGNIYTASWNGILKRYDQAGVEDQVFDVNDLSENNINGSFYDMNLFEHNSLILTNRNNQVVVVTMDFSQIELQNENYRAQFISTVPVIDTDADGMPAWWERKYGFSDADAADAAEDLDSDGLSNLLEFLHKVDPSNVDTDDDGLNDYIEIIIHLTNPNLIDTDKDGLSDGDEVLTYLTEPLIIDTDGDTFNDGDEILLFETDPNDAMSAPDSITELSINFSAATLSEHWSENDSSDATWSIENEVLRSGAISHNQESAISYRNVFSAGTLTFESRLDSESCCDYLEVFLDDIGVLTISTQGWQTNVITLSAGLHVVTFKYRKDSSVARGEDSAFIDNLVFSTN